MNMKLNESDGRSYSGNDDGTKEGRSLVNQVYDSDFNQLHHMDYENEKSIQST